MGRNLIFNDVIWIFTAKNKYAPELKSSLSVTILNVLCFWAIGASTGFCCQYQLSHILLKQ